MRTSKNLLEAWCDIYIGSKDAPVATRNFSMGFQFLPLAGMRSTTDSSNLHLDGGKFIGSKNTPIVSKSYTMVSQLLI